MYWISENWKPMYVIQQTMFDIEVCSQYRENLTCLKFKGVSEAEK